MNIDIQLVRWTIRINVHQFTVRNITLTDIVTKKIDFVKNIHLYADIEEFCSLFTSTLSSPPTSEMKILDL